MTREERELSITYLEGIKEEYIEGEGYERHPLPEWFALDKAIEAIEQEPVLDKIRAEIDAESSRSIEYPNWERAKALEWVLGVIDKYKTESESKE